MFVVSTQYCTCPVPAVFTMPTRVPRPAYGDGTVKVGAAATGRFSWYAAVVIGLTVCPGTMASALSVSEEPTVTGFAYTGDKAVGVEPSVV